MKKFDTQLEAINDLNMKLIEWNMTDKHQRFGQFLESSYLTLVLPPYYYESLDSYEVFSYMCDLFEMEYI